MKTGIIVVSVLGGVLVLGVGGYFLFFRKGPVVAKKVTTRAVPGGNPFAIVGNILSTVGSVSASPGGYPQYGALSGSSSHDTAAYDSITSGGHSTDLGSLESESDSFSSGEGSLDEAELA